MAAKFLIQVDYENNSEQFWANFREQLPDLAARLNDADQIAVTAETWAQIQEIPGFAAGPHYAPHALIAREVPPAPQRVYYAYSPAYDDSNTGYYATPEAAIDAYWSENLHTEDERRRANPIAVGVAVDAALLEDAAWLAADGRPSPALGIED